MKNISILIVALIISINANAQNSLLKNPTTGPLPITNNIVDIELVSNGTDVVLIAAAGTGYFYAIDIEDNDAGDAALNKVGTIPSFQALIDATTGTVGLSIDNIEVNPISNSVYVLVSGTGKTIIVKLTENGTRNSVLDYSNMTFSTIQWNSSNTYSKQDMTFGDGTLYITSGSFSLDGDIATIPTPFEHGTNTSNQATTMFKTNWGSQYFTRAPLERLAFADINGTSRLLGVTVCAPGFSIETSKVDGGGLLEVTEDFNVHYSPPVKVVHQHQNGDNYLWDLHTNFPNALLRIGNDFVDGSAVGRNKFNSTALKLRDNSGNVASGLDSSDIVIYPNSYDMIAFWDHFNLLVLENDELKLMETGVDMSTAAVNDDLLSQITLYPNPSTGDLKIEVPIEYVGSQLTIYNAEGKTIYTKSLNNQKVAIELPEFTKGNHIVEISGKDVKSLSSTIVVQ